jgi:hypothetical protein
METLLSDNRTYENIKKLPFKSLERKLNERLLDLKQQGILDDPTYTWLHSTDALPPSIQGSVKHHKQLRPIGNPLRPIITTINTAFYNTSRFLTRILSPLHENLNGLSVKHSADLDFILSNNYFYYNGNV